MKKTLFLLCIILFSANAYSFEKRDLHQKESELIGLSDEPEKKQLSGSLPWDYPVKPGTTKWKSLKSNEEKVLACQIPQIILDTVSNKVLLELCLKYPLLNDIYAFNNVNDGIDKLLEDFNGIKELFKRIDITEKLLAKYSELLKNNSMLEKNLSDFERGEYVVSISTLELLMSRIELQNKLTQTTQKEILRWLWEGYEIKKQKPNYFIGIGFRTNLLARGQIISDIEKNNYIKLNKGDYNDSFIKIIDEKTQEIIKR